MRITLQAAPWMLALLLLLPAAGGCASSESARGSDDAPAQAGEREGSGETLEQQRGRSSTPDSPSAGPRGEKPFTGDGPMTPDPAFVYAATGAGDPESFAGEVITIVVHAGSENASDANPGTRTAPLASISAAIEQMNGLARRDQFFHIVVGPGTYREAFRVRGVTGRNLHLLIEGRGDPVITGSERYTGWTSLGDGRYSHPWEYDWGLWTESEEWKAREANVPDGTKRWMLNAGDLFKRREAVFVDGALMRQVLDRDDLQPGTFLVDEAGDRIVLQVPDGVNPDVSTVEVAEKMGLFQLTGAENVTLRGLTFRHCTARPQWPMVELRDNVNVLVEDCAFLQSGARGMTVAASKTVTLRRVRANENGASGMELTGITNLLLEDCQTNGNNWRGNWADVHAWAIGGIKALYNVHVRVSRLTSTGNHCVGLWFDLDNINVTVEDCDLHDNLRHGLFFEAGRGPMQVVNSRMTGNGTQGLLIVNADRITARDNVIADNDSTQIYFRAYAREIESRYLGITEAMHSRHIRLFDNTVSSSRPGPTLWRSDQGPASLQRTLSTYEGDGNTWIHPTPDRAFRARGRLHGYQDWVKMAGEGARSTARRPAE